MSDPNNPYRSPAVQVSDFLPVDSADHYQVPANKLGAGRGSAWVGEAWALFKAQPLMWFCAFLLYMAIYMVCGIVPVLGNIASMLIGPMLSVGLLAFGRRQALSGAADLGELFTGFKGDKVGSLVLLSLLYLALMVVVVIVSVVFFMIGAGGAGILSQLGSEEGIQAALAGSGLLVFLMGFLIMLALAMLVVAAYWFAPGLVFFAGLEPVAAMKESFSACLRNWLPLLVYSLVLFGVFLLGMIPLLLGWLVAFPLAMATMYTSFEDLFGRG